MHLIYKRLMLLFVVSALSLSSYAQNGQTRITNAHNVPKFEILQESRSVGEAQTFLRQKLNLAPAAKYVPIKQHTDELGFTHTKYKQTYKGVDVVFGTYKVHSQNGLIKSFNGEYFQVDDLDVNPTLSKDAAFAKAIQHVGANEYMWDNPSASLMDYSKPSGELVIFPNLSKNTAKDQSAARLAYRFDIYASKPVSRAMIYIDAQTGDFLYADNIIHHVAPANGTAATRYSGSKTIQTDSYSGSYRLREYTRGNGIETYDMNTGTNYSNAVDFTDNNNDWTAAEFDNSAKDNAALDAHWGAEMTYDYWITKHNRNSFDDNGAKIKSYVHYDVAYDNAYWNGSVMTYGDGSGTYFDALTSLDVAGHEIGHAVMSYTADLTYSYESGAMNEGFSDIWGASIEYFAAPNKQTWLIGEDIERRAGHAALRSMSDPKSEGQPDTYQGTNWATGSSDNGGVHTNSGVLNYWYYLVSVGGSGTNDNGDTYSVTGIGIDDAAKIAYRMISVYMTSSSQYADARTFGIQSAVDLFGAGSAAEIAVTNAWHAVGIGGAYGQTSYCSSKGNSVSDEYIGRVQLNTIDNTSGATNGYSDYTSISTDLTIGNGYTITITPHWTGTVYSEGYSVWIDYNNDGDFSDA
ncbi:MAG TPA: peptidase M4 family protein, partial [Saprospiraceae bacterium]|nr:peptidase M4 family protein [Saprospiraceae bacterium]